MLFFVVLKKKAIYGRKYQCVATFFVYNVGFIRYVLAVGLIGIFDLNG
jgi:hypothetical protein